MLFDEELEGTGSSAANIFQNVKSPPLSLNEVPFIPFISANWFGVNHQGKGVI